MRTPDFSWIRFLIFSGVALAGAILLTNIPDVKIDDAGVGLFVQAFAGFFFMGLGLYKVLKDM